MSETPEVVVLTEEALKNRAKRFVSEPEEISFLTPEQVEALVKKQNQAV